MSRSQRLLDLIQTLRTHRTPVSGHVLAEQTGVSIRTLYRDIATLQAQGADIQGEVGVGYVLRPGFLLPPLMVSEQDIEALVLGSRWVAGRADDPLAVAASSALTKIAAVLPAHLSEELENSALLIGPGQVVAMPNADLGTIRTAIRGQFKVALGYRDEKGQVTQRIVWPFALAFFDQVRVLLAWCELREGFRGFRADRIASFDVQEVQYRRRRQALLKEWRVEMEERQKNTAAKN